MFWNNFRLPDRIWMVRRCFQGWLPSAFLPLASSPPSSSSSTSPASLPSGGCSSFHTFYATKLTTRRTLLTHLRGLLYLAIVTCSSAKVGSIKLWLHCIYLMVIWHVCKWLLSLLAVRRSACLSPPWSSPSPTFFRLPPRVLLWSPSQRGHPCLNHPHKDIHCLPGACLYTSYM